MTKEEKRLLLIEFIKWHRDRFRNSDMRYPMRGDADEYLDTIPDDGENGFKRCGQGENTCNCKSPDECGYNEIYEGIAKLKH